MKPDTEVRLPTATIFWCRSFHSSSEIGHPFRRTDAAAPILMIGERQVELQITQEEAFDLVRWHQIREQDVVVELRDLAITHEAGEAKFNDRKNQFEIWSFPGVNALRGRVGNRKWSNNH